jgi:hypothetical protein
MEPTPELHAMARDLVGPGASDTEHTMLMRQMMARAAEYRAVLEPFERAAAFPSSVKLAVEHGVATVEQMRAVAQRQLAAEVSARPATYKPAAPATRWQRIVAWLRENLP